MRRSTSRIVPGIVLAFFCVACFSACSSTPKKSENIYTSDARFIAVTKSQSFILRLESDPTAGCRWNWDQPLDNSILALGYESFSSPGESETGKGYQDWHFRAVDGGTAVIALKYVKLSSRDTAPIRTHRVIVTVK